MVDTSSFYNLSNPGLNNDIGDAYFNQMYPNSQLMTGSDYIPGITGCMNGVNINGQLDYDTFENERGRKSKMSPLAKIALAVTAIGGAVICLKIGKAGCKNLWEKIKGLFKKEKKD